MTSYGGLYVEQANHTTSVFENRRDFQIYEDTVHFKMLIAWYYRYSFVKIKGYLMSENCSTRYLHLSSSPIYHQIVLKNEVQEDILVSCFCKI